MIASLKEAAEEATTNDTSKNSNKPQSSPSPTSWLKLKDPRIVRVSKAFGGKDRHSKVCTVRGLRDRRVRLSVPTAIQLYDLQDRLGLNQPSKVVDWLLNAAKHEMDELPPLPIPPGCFSLNHQMLLASQPNKDRGETTVGSSSRSDFWNPETQGRCSTEPWLNNSVVPFGSVNYQLEPQSFGFPSLATTTHHGEEENNLQLGNFNFVQLPPTLSLSSSSSGVHQPNQEIGPRTISHLQMLSSDSQTNNISVPDPFQHTNHSGLFTLNATQGKLINQTKDNVEYCYTS